MEQMKQNQNHNRKKLDLKKLKITKLVNPQRIKGGVLVNNYVTVGGTDTFEGTPC